MRSLRQELVLFWFASLALLALAVLWPRQAKADVNVLKLYAGANGAWLSGADGSAPHDLEFGINGRASIQPHLSIVGSVYRGVSDGGYTLPKVGGRFTVSDVENRDISIGIGAQYQWPSNGRPGPKGWIGDVTLGAKPWAGAKSIASRAIVILQGEVALEQPANGETRPAGARLGLRYEVTR